MRAPFRPTERLGHSRPVIARLGGMARARPARNHCRAPNPVSEIGPFHA